MPTYVARVPRRAATTGSRSPTSCARGFMAPRRASSRTSKTAGFEKLERRRPGADAHPRRHAGVHPADPRSRLQGSDGRAAGAPAHPRRHAARSIDVRFRRMRRLRAACGRSTDLVQFRIHGVSPDFIREARAAGFKDLDEDDLVRSEHSWRARWVAKRKVRGSRKSTLGLRVHDGRLAESQHSELRISILPGPNRNSSASGSRAAHADSVWAAPGATRSRQVAATDARARRIFSSFSTLPSVSAFQSSRPVSVVPTPR